MEKIKKIIKNTLAIIVLLSLIAIIFYQNRDRDFMKFGKSESEKTSEELQAIEGTSLDNLNGDIAKVGNKIVSITPNAFTTFNKNGERKIKSIAISLPVLQTEGEYMLYYSNESKEISVYKGEKEYYNITTENRIIRAKVNRNGYALVVTEKEGYSSEATVYNRSGEEIFFWNLSKSEFLDGDINSDNDKIVLSVIDAVDKLMQGKLMLIDITSAKVVEKQTFDSEIFYNVDFNRNGTYIATGSNKLAYFNASGTLKWEYDYTGRELLKQDVSEPDVMVLAFSAAGSGIRGNSTEIEVIDRLGKVISKRTINSIADDVSVSGQRVAIAFGKKLYILNRHLEDEKVIEAESSIKKTEFFSDSEHLFILGRSSEQIVEI